MAAPEVIVHPMQAPRLVSREGLRVREDTLFADHKAQEKKGVRKRAEETLERLGPLLARVLEPDEAVFYAARCLAPASGFEKYSFGWHSYYVMGTMLVITNRRLLHFHLKIKSFGGWEWGRGVRSVHWGDIEEAKAKGWLNPVLRLKYNSGVKEEYWGFRRGDIKAIKLLLDALLPQSVGDASPSQAMAPLCPECLAVFRPEDNQCGQCGLAFKSQKEMIWRSLAFPGGGYFYVGARGLGIIDAAVESVILGLLLGSLLIAAGLPEAGLGPLESSLTPGEALATALVVLFILAIEKLMTIYHGRRFLKSFIPAEKKPSPVKWAAIGVLSYALVALIAVAHVSWEEPVARVAPDITVQEASFGLFARTPQDPDMISFESAFYVPLAPGELHGWVLRVRTPRESVRFRAEYHMLEPEDAVETGSEEELLFGGYDPVTVSEGDATLDGDVLFGFWEVSEGETPGPRRLDLYIEEVQVGRFEYVAQ
jgi:hypothetical protein